MGPRENNFLLVGHKDGRSIHFLLKMYNTRSPLTLERNALALQNLTQMYSFERTAIPLTFWNRNLLFNASEF